MAKRIGTYCATAYVHLHCCVPRTTTSCFDVQDRVNGVLAAARLRGGCSEECGVTSRVAQGHGRSWFSYEESLGVTCVSVRPPDYIPGKSWNRHEQSRM